MSQITLRNVKGNVLTYSELDDNFIYLSQSYLPLSLTSSLSVLSSSYAQTASNISSNNVTLQGNLTVLGTASFNYLHVTYESASVIYSSGSNQFGDATNDFQVLFGTIVVSGSQQITGSLNAPNITGSLFGTSSQAISASYPLRGTGKAIYSFDTSNTNTTNVIAIGESAGDGATNANNSNFLGYYAGYSATNANNSNFIGNSAGYASSNANNSNFIGKDSGRGASSAEYSSFLGQATGYGASFASYSFFAGLSAGYGAVRASDSVFIGRNAGDSAVSASNSVLIGLQVGRSYNTSIGSNNIIIGTNITLEKDRRDSINIGGYIFGTGSYSSVIGNAFSGSVNGKLGINQPLPQYSLDVSGSGGFRNGLTVTGSLISPSITGSLQGTSSWANNAVSSSYPIAITGSSIYSYNTTNVPTIDSIALGFYAASGTTSGISSIYIGNSAGSSNTTSIESIFIGKNSGISSVNIQNSTILNEAGRSSTNIQYSNLIGYYSGDQNSNVYGSNIIGFYAGSNASNIKNSNFIGLVGAAVTNVTASNFIGVDTGHYTSGSSYSTLIGYKVGFNDSLDPSLGIKSNNIIIGTNITLENGRRDSINIGGIIFGTGSYSVINSYPDPTFSGSANGMIGINQPLPKYSLDVSGSGGFSGGLTVTGSLKMSTTTGTPSNTSTPAGYYQAELNGSTVYIPYYT